MLTATDLKTTGEVTVLEIENSGNGVWHRRAIRASLVWVGSKEEHVRET